MDTTIFKSRFIVIEGPDGVGKTTHVAMLADSLRRLGLDVVTAIDPGGTPIGQSIRRMLLHGTVDMSSECETFLYMASRAELMSKVILPALDDGKTVICDRFISSTLAYQGALGVQAKYILDLGRLAARGRWPDLTVLLERGWEQCLEAIVDKDRIESRGNEYFQKVNSLFNALGRIYPTPVVRVSVERDDTVQQVSDILLHVIHEQLVMISGTLDDTSQSG